MPCFLSGFGQISWKIPQWHITFGHLGPPSLPIDVHHFSPSGFKTLVINGDDSAVDGGASFWASALHTWSLCVCGTDAVQTGGQKVTPKGKVSVLKNVCQWASSRKEWFTLLKLCCEIPGSWSLQFLFSICDKWEILYFQQVKKKNQDFSLLSIAIPHNFSLLIDILLFNRTRIPSGEFSVFNSLKLTNLKLGFYLVPQCTHLLPHWPFSKLPSHLTSFSPAPTSPLPRTGLPLTQDPQGQGKIALCFRESWKGTDTLEIAGNESYKRHLLNEYYFKL